MGCLRIHFTEADLGRTRLSTRVDYMWESVGAVQLLQHRGGGLYFDAWRQRIRERAHADSRLRQLLHMLMQLAPHANYFPDFLTPTEEFDGLDAALDAVASVPKHQLRAETVRLGTETSFLRSLSDGDLAARRDLRTAWSTFHRAVIEPEEESIQAALHADLAHRVHIYVHHGIGALLPRLSVEGTWTPPVLTLSYPFDRDLFLDGRGLRLVPSFFCSLHPVALADPLLPPTLVFPIESVTRLLATERQPGDHLGALLGNTRAAILRLVAEGCDTRELIRRVGVAPATVTHHTNILRSAGMIATRRDGGTAAHRITSLGIRVLCRST